MLQRLILAPIFVVLVAITSCQSYSSGLQQSVTRVDETAAIGALRTILTAQRSYSITSGDYGTFQQLTDAGLLDARFRGSNPVKDYVLTLQVTQKAAGAQEGSYSCNADPAQPETRSGRHFYIDSTSGQIHVNDAQPATVTDKTLD
jgi:hypothetical protein